MVSLGSGPCDLDYRRIDFWIYYAVYIIPQRKSSDFVIISTNQLFSSTAING